MMQSTKECCICYSYFIHLTDVKLQLQRRRISTVSSALAETAASMAVAVTFVGAAATLIVKRSKTSEPAQVTTLVIDSIRKMINCTYKLCNMPCY